MEIEITIPTCLGGFTFTINAMEVEPHVVEEALTEMAIRAWDEDHADDEWIVVPDYFEDPEGHRKAMEDIIKKRAANDNEGQKTIKIQIPSNNIVGAGITWGGLA